MKRFFALWMTCSLSLAICTACAESGTGKDIPAPAESSETTKGSVPTGTGVTEIITTTAESPEPGTEPSDSGNTAPQYSVRDAAWDQVQWTQYQCIYFTVSVPEGWDVQWQGDVEYMTWQVKNPDNTMIGVSNTDHAYAAKDPAMMQTLGMSLAMRSGTVQEFFEALFAPSTDYYTVLNTAIPANAEIVAAQNPAMHGIRDYQSCYAIFAENGVEGEGIYQAAVMDNQAIYIRGQNYASWFINAIFTEYAPRGELVNWMPVLNSIINSFRYTDYYLQEKMYQTGIYPDSAPTVDTNSVTESFEERMKDDEIIQAKRSDMIGEYERVYDNETNQIYRAYNGFLDDIGTDQTRYTAITDPQYAEGYVGWIEK